MSNNRDPKSDPKPWVLDVDPATVLAIVAALLLLPLLVAGFMSQ